MNASEKKKILVVEDNAMNMELVADVLEAEGYAVHKAVTAEEGIRRAEAEQPALILLDISLPGMDGIAAARMLKINPRTAGIPLIALTAHVMQGDRERVREAGCDGYLMKPIDVATFRKDIARFLRGEKQEREIPPGNR